MCLTQIGCFGRVGGSFLGSSLILGCCGRRGHARRVWRECVVNGTGWTDARPSLPPAASIQLARRALRSRRLTILSLQSVEPHPSSAKHCYSSLRSHAFERASGLAFSHLGGAYMEARLLLYPFRSGSSRSSIPPKASRIGSPTSYLVIAWGAQ